MHIFCLKADIALQLGELKGVNCLFNLRKFQILVDYWL